MIYGDVFMKDRIDVEYNKPLDFEKFETIKIPPISYSLT